MVDLISIPINREVLKLIPKRLALEYSALPISADGENVTVALVENFDKQILSDLSFLLGRKVIPEVAKSDALSAAISHHYRITEVDIAAIMSSETPSTTLISARPYEENLNFDLGGNESVVTLVNRIISDAIRMKASDIHVEPYERSMRIRYRMDGVLQETLHPRPEMAKPLISRLKIMADLDIAEKRRPQDGRIRATEGDRTIDIRVSTLPTDFGEKVVLRILDKSQLELDLEKLGFEETDLALFKRTVKFPYGMILVTGPTGSGKTTTLYAALSYVNKPEINITTIEDPIEYNLAGINQTHIRSEIGLTFAHALRSILRQDPNVIMLGEIRDGETAEIAIRAALTGHMVFSTLHTNDASSAITRLTEMGIEPFLVGTSIRMILAQRLLRMLCSKCKLPFQPTSKQLEEVHAPNVFGGREQQFYRAVGCRECNQIGYRGRTAVYEVLTVGDILGSMIAKGAPALELRKQAQTSGMLTLHEAALRKAARGLTTLDEVIRETVF